ncbi:MAG TPA: hypothetical protein VH092_33365 [Urbifossiella sp.]|nr:hypothetical protein [Urbifossiella sp.]
MAAGRRRDPDLALTTLLDATERKPHAATRDSSMKGAATELKLIGLPTVLAVGIPAYVLGAWHWVPPAAGLRVLYGYLWLVRLQEARVATYVRARNVPQQDEGWCRTRTHPLRFVGTGGDGLGCFEPRRGGRA